METDTTYTPPPMLQSIDDDEIHARMLEALPSDIDKTEGGFAYDFTRPAALEKASAHDGFKRGDTDLFSGLVIRRISGSDCR